MQMEFKQKSVFIKNLVEIAFKRIRKRVDKSYIFQWFQTWFRYINQLKMFKVREIATKSLMGRNGFGFAGLGFGKKREKVKSDLDKYDVVIVGAHLGGVLSNHLDGAVGEKASIFVAYDNPYYQYHAIRGFYEQGSFTKFQMSATAKAGINKFAAHSDGQGVAKFLPQSNQVVLRNGRTIGYDQLVIASGMDTDYQAIPGFEQAWEDNWFPFYCNQDHPSWRTTASKPFRYQYNFNGGQAIFYIPPAPFHGSLENYNFLLSKKLWDRHEAYGKFSWANSSFTVINANNSFCPFYEQGDAFFRNQLEAAGVNVEFGLRLVEVKKDTQTAVFENIATRETSERPFHNMYSLMPAKPHQNLREAGLADATGFLDVDPFTLQHRHYDNVFGLGDVSNLPTTKTFYGGFSQVHVLRSNLDKRLNGLPFNARYDGHSEALVHSGIEGLALVGHDYDGSSRGALDTGLAANLRYRKFNLFGKKELMNICKFKNWGPPYYKFKKTFADAPASSASSSSTLHPQPKSA